MVDGGLMEFFVDGVLVGFVNSNQYSEMEKRI
jgi:hypothetical protein